MNTTWYHQPFTRTHPLVPSLAKRGEAPRNFIYQKALWHGVSFGAVDRASESETFDLLGLNQKFQSII